MAELKGAVKGGTFGLPKDAWVYHGGWKQIKGGWVRDGEQWEPFFAPTVTLSASATSATSGQTVVMTPTVRLPGTVAKLEWWHMAPGTTDWTLDTWTGGVTGANHWVAHTAGAWKWRVHVVPLDSKVPTHISDDVIITVTVPRSTATVSGPKVILGTGAGAGSSHQNTIVEPTFNFTLSSPSAAKAVYFEITPWVDPITWNRIGVWTPGGAGGYAAIPGGSWTWSFATANFNRGGMWSVRVLVEHSDGHLYESGHHAFEVYNPVVVATATPSNPTVGSATILRAGMSPAAPAGLTSSAEGWWYLSHAGGGWTRWNNYNYSGYPWTPGNTTVHDFVWVETFSDGSRIHSNNVRVSPQGQTEVYRHNGDGNTVQQALDEGAQKGLPVRFTGVFTSGSVGIPANARVTATEATFNSMRFTNAGGGGGYSRAGNIVWNGGNFDAFNQISAVFAISHCPSFQLHNARIWNTTTKGHGIEINSSGGAAYGGSVLNMGLGDFKIQIVGCTFDGMDQRPRSEGYDEAVHFDYAWPGATWAGTAGDGTVCHNVLIRGCHFRRARLYPYPTSIGNHKFSVNESPAPKELHSHLRIDGNNFDAVGACSDVGSDSIMSATMASRGTVHLVAFRQVLVDSNTFSHNVRAFAYESRSNTNQTQGEIRVTNNAFIACGHMRNHSGHWVGKNYPWVDTDINDNTGGRINTFLIYHNTFTATVPAAQATWMIRCNDVDTLHVNENRFWGLIGNQNYAQQTGNRIHGSEKSPSGTVTGYQCRNNTWSSAASGAGAVIANS